MIRVPIFCKESETQIFIERERIIMESLEEKRRKRWEEFAKLSGGKNAKTSLKFEVRVAYDVSSVVSIFLKNSYLLISPIVHI